MGNTYQIDGIDVLSQEEVKSINGGIIPAVAICLFALGVAIGVGIGNRVQRR